MNQNKIVLLVIVLIFLFTNLCFAQSCDKSFEINKKLGRGVNLGNALEAPREGLWGVTLKEEYFKLIKQAGFDTVRIPISWSAHAQQSPPYTIEPDFFKRIDWVVKNALDNNLNAIINIHHYRELFSDPNNHSKRFIALWQQISQRYKDYPDILLFELLNEPHNALNYKKWNVLLADALKAIRQTNPDRIIVIGPAWFNGIDHLPLLQLPVDDRNIIVTCHYYLPFKFTHQGAEWVGFFSKNWLGTKWTGTEKEKQDIENDFDKALQWSRKNNRPINIGEFGSIHKADMASRALYTDFVARTAEKKGFSWTYWEFCAGFGIYDKNKELWRKPLLKALIPDSEVAN
jgi:endoglucanase